MIKGLFITIVAGLFILVIHIIGTLVYFLLFKFVHQSYREFMWGDKKL